MRVFAPFTIVLLVSFVLFGFYPLEWVTVEVDQWFNASLWPMSIPIGLTLAVAAIYRRRIQFAMAASPLLSPMVVEVRVTPGTSRISRAIRSATSEVASMLVPSAW